MIDLLTRLVSLTGKEDLTDSTFSLRVALLLVLALELTD